MRRFALIVLLAALALYSLAGWVNARRAASAPVPVEQAASPAVVYGELRARISEPPRYIEMVGIIEFPSMAVCTQPRVGDLLGLACSKPEASCVITRFDCRHDIDDRYRRMLDAKPASTHYTHFVVGPDGVPGRPRIGHGALGAQRRRRDDPVPHDHRRLVGEPPQHGDLHLRNPAVVDHTPRITSERS